MPKPPKSRQIVLDAAAAIVRERGAANLTFEELAEVSGVTRGGITYHFPTKRDLLVALLNRDVAQWAEREAAQVGAACCAQTALLEEIRIHTNGDNEHRRFVAGMLSAVAHDPDLLEPVRNFHRQRQQDINWTPAELRRQILRLAAEGLFWSDIFQCGGMPPSARTALIQELETLAKQWSEPES